MKMNRIEKVVMNSPVRSWFLRHVEAPLLLRLSKGLRNLRILELGCGQGSGTELLFSLFGAGHVTAIDIDPEMIERARARLKSRFDGRLSLAVGNAAEIDASENTFDAVVDFAALHHVPQWQVAVGEVCRVLKPGGEFLFEEVTAQWIRRWPYRSLFLHPQENRFAGIDFVRELESRQLKVGHNYIEKKKGDFIFGVATKVHDLAAA